MTNYQLALVSPSKTLLRSIWAPGGGARGICHLDFRHVLPNILIIHSFISNIYIAPLQERLLRGAANSSAAKKNSLQKREERER